MRALGRLGYVAAALAALALTSPRTAAADLLPLALGVPYGCNVSFAVAINDSGQCAGIVGTIDETTQAVAFSGCMWQDREPIVLPPLGDKTGDGLANYTDGYAFAINSAGVVVGYSFGDTAPGSGGATTSLSRAVRWTIDSDGAVTAVDLGTLPGDNESEAMAINDQGQVLCKSFRDGVSGTRWFLWEERAEGQDDDVRTPIQTAGGLPVDAEGASLFFGKGLLAADGSVAGQVDVGSWTTADPPVWVHETYQAVLWTKTGVTVMAEGQGADVTAMSNGGVVSGTDGTGAPFVYDAGGFHPVTFPTDGDLVVLDHGDITDVNDAGRAVIPVQVTDGVTAWVTLAVWQAGAVTYIPLDALLGPDEVPQYAAGFINSCGQVLGIVQFDISPMCGVRWTPDVGTERLVDAGTGTNLGMDLNASGLVCGIISLDGFTGQAVLWGAAIDAALGAVARDRKKVLVDVVFSNPFAVQVTDIVVTAVTLKDSSGKEYATTSKLPIKVGALKPGVAKPTKLEFGGDVPTTFTLTIEGSSSAGTFTKELVFVP